MQIDGVRLGRLVVEHGRDGADVETAGGEVGGEKVGGVGGSEGFDGGDALLGEKVRFMLRESAEVNVNIKKKTIPVLGSYHHEVQ